MSNMSYCRFENTLGDLKDCRDALEEEGIDGLSESELKAYKKLVEVCREIVEFEDEQDSLEDDIDLDDEGDTDGDDQ